MSNIIKEWAPFSIEIALLAGDVLKKGFGSQLTIDSKPGKQNLMTKCDRAIDPLDGTLNFVHEIPPFSMSTALAVDKEVVCGVVYQPMTKELFVTQKQQGALLNSRSLNDPSVSQIDQAFLATGFPYDVHKNPMHCIEHFSEVLRTGVPIRRLSSAAIDLAYVASGRFDGFWETGFNSWNLTAGMLLVKEASGVVTHYDRTEHQLFGYHDLISNK
ncbi:MAG: hypothetical protein LBC45_05145 [Chlamydiales bacterium]|jgi:myo-inositol-1(or 4)-monophosphatase|nr:hypothetical protein [Chlamydiales bacterium]